jgi:murein DD-endopeptidase MepM/ murein hydrolase activator NlpD
MGQLVYSPGIRIVIETSRKGIIDVSEDLTSGTIQLNENRPHNISFELENAGRKYDGLFLSNDRFSVQLKRLRWLQIMTGYLIKTPLLSAYPGSIQLSGSCTLKKLVTTFFDPGAEATVDLFNKYSGSNNADGSMTDRAKAFLIEVGQWPEERIHIGALPTKWFEAVSGVYTQISPNIAPTTQVGANGVVNGSPVGGNVTPGADGSVTAAQMVKVAAGAGFTGDNLVIAMAVAKAESSWRVDALNYNSNGSTDRGLWQINSVHDKQYPDSARLLSDPAYNAKAAFEISGGGTNFNPWTTYKSGAYQQYMAESRAAVSSDASAANTPTRRTPDALDKASSTGPRPAGVPQKLIFPVPGANHPLKTIDGVSWGWHDTFGASRESVRGKGAVHEGQDLCAAIGTPIVSMTDGVVITPIHVGEDGGAGGIALHIRDDLGNTYYYAHAERLLVAVGDRVKAGQQIAILDTTGDARKAGIPHCHFEFHPGGGAAVNATALLNAAEGGTDVTANTDPSIVTGGQALAVTSEASSLLTGARRLMNDQPILPTIGGLFAATMRSYCSAPNGDFISWFPDLFGQFGASAKISIEQIETQNFSIDMDDTGFVTHQFVTGSIIGWTGDGLGFDTIVTDPSDVLTQMLDTMGIASIEFPEVLKLIVGVDDTDWTVASQILRRFGARPDGQNVSAIIDPRAEFFYAVYLLMQNWANLFSTDLPISFMPELWPGMIASFKHLNIQVYIESVTHTFNLGPGGGFETRASVKAPATLDGKFLGARLIKQLDPRPDTSVPVKTRGPAGGAAFE